MDIKKFDFDLPDHLIAQYPLKNRSQSRLLEVNQCSNVFTDREFKNLMQVLRPGDLLVANDTRVLPARMYVFKPTGGKVQIMLERQVNQQTARVLLKANRPIKIGQRLHIGQYSMEVIDRNGPFFMILFDGKATVKTVFEKYGAIPLPPYIARQPEKEDRDRYQTVYSKTHGAVAAPTAGLHFDNTLLKKLGNCGVGLGFITLHIGAGTFQPVKVEDIENHKMHSERIIVSQEICDKIRTTIKTGGRVVAVGTTVVRALETAAKTGGLMPVDVDSDLFIMPGYKFKVVDALITNFHLPRSTLLMMISAFAGYEKIMSAYQYAIKKGYRFFSYGDAMYLERKQ